MKIDIMTLFPDAIDAMMGQSIMGRAQDRGYIKIVAHQIRDYTTNKQMQVDSYPYGGGRGVGHAGGPPVPLLGAYLPGGRPSSGPTPSTCRPAAGNV
ncbi:MAG: hypothetical protein ACLSHM_01660 [Vescimonas sp.]